MVSTRNGDFANKCTTDLLFGEVSDGAVVKNHMRLDNFPPIMNVFDEHMIDFGEIEISLLAYFGGEFGID